MAKVLFKRKTTDEIKDLEIQDGALIYNTDNGKTYMDFGENRIQTGGNADTMIAIGGEEAPTDTDIKLWFPKNTVNTKASFENGTILFSSDDGELGNFTLNESVTKYKYLEIEFNTNNVYKIVKCSTINPNVELSISRADRLDNSYYGIRIEVGKLYISGTSVARSLGYKVTIKATDSSVIFSDSNEIKVNKVVGYN